MPKTKRKAAKKVVKKLVVSRKQLKSAEKKFKKMTKPVAKKLEAKLVEMKKAHWLKRAFKFVGAGVMMGLAALTAWRVRDSVHGVNFQDIKKQVTKKAVWASHEAEKQLRTEATKAKQMFKNEAKKALSEANKRVDRIK